MLGYTLAVAAKRAVVPPACLGPWTSVVGWSGVKIIWRGASGTPQGNRGRWGLGLLAGWTPTLAGSDLPMGQMLIQTYES